MSQFYAHRIQKPSDDAEFEGMCARVYGEVHSDSSPKRNGRRGQKQSGVDVFVRASEGRIGIQCKRYKDGGLTFRHVEKEVAAADSGEVSIKRLIIATTAASDSNLVGKVLLLSDEREAAGHFPVEIDFWEEIEAHITGSVKLLSLYDPISPGGSFHRFGETQESMNQAMVARFDQLSRQVSLAQSASNDTSVPASRQSSLNQVVTSNIDGINDLLKAGRYRDANERLDEIWRSFDAFDEHQKARWYVQRSVCRVHLFDGKGAADDLLEAARLYPHDEKIAAAGVRGLHLLGRVAEAVVAGKAASKAFPGSGNIWAATAYARLDAGEMLTIDDVPPELIGDVDVLTAMCSAAQKAGDMKQSWAYGRQILRHPDARQPSKSAAFATALSWAAGDPVKRTYGLIDADAMAALAEAVEIFHPRTTALWTNQSLVTLPADVSNLCYAYYLLDRYDDLLSLCTEASSMDPYPEHLLGLKLASLLALGRPDEMMESVKGKVSELQGASIMMVAEGAASRGDVELVDELALHAAKIEATDVVPKVVSALRTIALLHRGSDTEAVREALAIGYVRGDHPGAALVAVRTLLAANQVDAGAQRLDAVAAAITEEAGPQMRLMLADCLFFAKRFSEAAIIYAPYCSTGKFSELHGRLFRAYVESGLRAKARDLLASFPPEWVNDDSTREAAIFLAQKATDWHLLSEMAKEQIQRSPMYAGSWLLALHCEHFGGSKEKFIALLGEVPEPLQGSFRQVAQVASLQFQFGTPTNGMRSLYCMMRSNMQSTEAASAYMMSFMMQRELSELTAPIGVAAPGTSCIMRSENGAEMTVNIDPDCMEALPQQLTYFQATSDVAIAVIGKSVGDTVDIKGPFGSPRAFLIERIIPVYLHLLHTIQEMANQTPEGIPRVQSVQVINEDGSVDVSAFRKLAQPGSRNAQFVFDAYANGPMTLGIMAHALQTTTVELIRDWPLDASPLRISLGTNEERTRAGLLQNADVKAIVVDLATLGDLVSLGCEASLASVPVVYISATAVQMLNGLREEAADDRSLGRACEIEGQLRIFAYPADYASKKIGFYDRIAAAISRYCEVCAVYGTSDLSIEMADMDGKLGDDEYAALLLAIERKAILLSVDLHCRQMADICLKVEGIWPQAIMIHAVNTGHLDWITYRNATQQMFRSNRTHVYVDARDLLFMCLQGGESLQGGLAKVAGIFGSRQSDVITSNKVVEELLDAVSKAGVTLSVLLELVEFLYEPFFRHPDCPLHFQTDACTFLRNFAQKFRSLPRWIPRSPVRAAEDQRLRAIGEILTERVEVARQRALMPPVARKVPIKTLFVTKQPTLWA